MARVAVTINSLTPGVALTEPAGIAADPTNDHVVNCSAFPLEELVLRIANTNGTDRVATIVAGDDPPASAAGQGDLAITVPATTGVKWVAGLESARFLQNDGTLQIDLAASFAGTITAYRVPRSV